MGVFYLVTQCMYMYELKSKSPECQTKFCSTVFTDFFLIAPFPDLCLLIPFSKMKVNASQKLASFVKKATNVEMFSGILKEI